MGAKPPTTWDELRAFARAAQVRAGGGSVSRWGFVCPIAWWFWAALVGQAGGEVVEADGRITLGGDAGVRALRFWQTLVHEDGTMKPPPGRDYNAWQVANTDFLAGRAAMIWTSTAFLRYLEDNARFPVVAAPLPRDARAAVPIGGTLFVMPKGSPEPVQQAAFRFLTWMMEPDQTNQWAHAHGLPPCLRDAASSAARSGLLPLASERSRSRSISSASRCRGRGRRSSSACSARPSQPRLEEAVLGRKDARAGARRTRAARRARTP